MTIKLSNTTEPTNLIIMGIKYKQREYRARRNRYKYL
jgi:hypothetical protein